MTTTTMEKNPFVSWGSKEIESTNNEFTGVITYRRGNGSRLCEREMFKGATWGCSRYYDAKNQYVGHEWYGKPGYNEKSLAYASKTVSVHTAWVDRTEYQRIYEATVVNYEDKKRQKVKYEFKSTGGDWAGLEVSLGSNGKPLVEQEMKGGTPFGCRRFYNEEGSLVGQELYGGVDWACKNGGNHIALVDTSSKAMRSTPPSAPFLTRFVTQKEFDQVKQEFKRALASQIVEVAVGSLAENKQDKPASRVKVSHSPKAVEKDEGDSLSTLDSTRSGNEIAKDNQPDPALALLAKQIAELMERQNLQDEKLEQERMQRVLVEEQLEKERLSRAELEQKLREVDASVVILKKELEEKEEKEKANVQAAEKLSIDEQNSQQQLWEQLHVQQKLIQAQQHLLEETQKQGEQQQAVISNLDAEMEEERRQRQVQQTEINKLREEIATMKMAKQEDMEPSKNINQRREEPEPKDADTCRDEEIKGTHTPPPAENTKTENETETQTPSIEIEDGDIAPNDTETDETAPTETENAVSTTLVEGPETSHSASGEAVEEPSEGEPEAMEVAPLESEQEPSDLVAEEDPETVEVVSEAPMKSEQIPSDQAGNEDGAQESQSVEPEVTELFSEAPPESEKEPGDLVGSGESQEGDLRHVKHHTPGLIVEDPKPRPPRHDSKKKKFNWRRPSSFNASFKLPARSKSKETMSPPGATAVSVGSCNEDANMDHDAETLASVAAPPTETNNEQPRANEQESTAQAEAEAEPISEPPSAPAAEDSVTSEAHEEEAKKVVEGDEEAGEEASISCIEEDNIMDHNDSEGEDEDAPSCGNDEIASSSLVQDPLPRPARKKKGFQKGLNASIKALKHPHASFNASFKGLVF